MARTRSARNRNFDSSSRKRGKTADDGVSSSWANLQHDLLFSILMKLGIIDFIAFSGVCQSWRSFANANRESFMVSKDPLTLSMSPHATRTCYLTNSFHRKFKTLLPNFDGRSCVGVSCGYLIMFGRKTRDFWLVNPITRHEIKFPVLSPYKFKLATFRPVLVFSPSLSSFVLVIFFRDSKTVVFSLSGHADWNCVVTDADISDIHAFKGKIYLLHRSSDLIELRLYPEPTLMPLNIQNCPQPPFAYIELVNSSEKLFLLNSNRLGQCVIRELDFDKAKWVVSGRKCMDEHAIFLCELKCSAIIECNKWVNPGKDFVDLKGCFVLPSKTLCTGSLYSEVTNIPVNPVRAKFTNVWLFPHECYSVNVLQE